MSCANFARTENNFHDVIWVMVYLFDFYQVLQKKNCILSLKLNVLNVLCCKSLQSIRTIKNLKNAKRRVMKLIFIENLKIRFLWFHVEIVLLGIVLIILHEKRFLKKSTLWGNHCFWFQIKWLLNASVIRNLFPYRLTLVMFKNWNSQFALSRTQFHIYDDEAIWS